MGNPYFKFKQFTVFHDKCAMKVGTDGVLLGAWTNLEKSGATCPDLREAVRNETNGIKVLDVGTGTGLIALMMAQRNLLAQVLAIDVDEPAVVQAKENVAHSPFSDRIAVECIDFRSYAENCVERFDLIVSNPPYFSDSLLPPNKKRAGARHSVSLTLDELLLSAKRCLADEGRVSLVVPYDKDGELACLCEKHSFYVKRKTTVHPLPDTPPKRLLVELTLTPVEVCQTTSLTIETFRHHYSDEFTSLVKNFYLHH